MWTRDSNGERDIFLERWGNNEWVEQKMSYIKLILFPLFQSYETNFMFIFCLRHMDQCILSWKETL